MTTKTAAELIAAELTNILTPARLAAYASDESWNDSLGSNLDIVTIVAAQLGDDYDASAWEDAMDLIRGAAALAANERTIAGLEKEAL